MTTTTSGRNRDLHGTRPEPEEHDVPETPTDPSAIVEAFLAAFVAMDFDTALTYVAADAEYTNVPMGTVR